MIFSDRQSNYPQRIFGKWWLTQFRRWGMMKGAPDYEGVSKKVLRSDIYLEAMKEWASTPQPRRRRSRSSTAPRRRGSREVRAFVPRSQHRLSKGAPERR